MRRVKASIVIAPAWGVVWDSDFEDARRLFIFAVPFLGLVLEFPKRARPVVAWDKLGDELVKLCTGEPTKRSYDPATLRTEPFRDRGERDGWLSDRIIDGTFRDADDAWAWDGLYSPGVTKPEGIIKGDNLP